MTRVVASYTQECLWLASAVQQDEGSYNESLALRIIGVLDRALLERSINKITRRHEILRTTFEVRDGALYQVISAVSPSRLSEGALAGLSERDRAVAARSLHKNVSQQPFDMTEGPLWRNVLLRTESETNILIVSAHHLVGDAWSLSIFLGELKSIFADLRAGRVPQLSQLAMQYGDFANWQRQWVSGDRAERQMR